MYGHLSKGERQPVASPFAAFTRSSEALQCDTKVGPPRANCYYSLNVAAQRWIFDRAMATLEQVSALNSALVSAQSQIVNLSTELDKLRIASEQEVEIASETHSKNLAAVRQEASDAVAELKQRLAAVEERGGGKEGE